MSDLKIKIEADVAQANAGLKTTQQALAATASAAVKADSSLEGLGKSINSAVVPIGKAATSSTSAASKFSELSSKVFIATSEIEGLGEISQLAGLGMAGIEVAALSAVSAFIKYINEVSNAVQAQRDLNESLDNSAASVQGNVTRLSILVSIAKDVTKSDAERQEAIGALNKEYDGFNKSLTLANINTEKATDLIDKQTAAIVRQAQIKGLENLITKESERQAEILNSKLEDNITTLGKAKVAILGGLGANYLGVNVGAVDAFENINKTVNDSKERVKVFSESLKKLLGEEALAGTLFEEKGAKSAVKNVITVGDVLAKLGREIDFLNQKEILFNTNETKSKIKEIENTIEKLVRDFKVAPNDTIIKKLFGDINSLLPYLLDNIGDRKIKIKTSLEISDDLKKAQDEINKELQSDKRIKPVRLRYDIYDAQRKLEAFYKHIDELNQKATDGLKDTFLSAFSSIGESIGDSLAKGANFGQVVFGNLFKVLGQGLKQLGEAMIGIGTAKVALEKFEFAPGIATVVAGIATVALGALLQNAIPGFANGVRGFRGGMALVGERGPELVRLPNGSDVIPNHKLNGMDSGGVNVTVGGNFELDGRKLRLVLNRTEQSNSRNGI